MVNIFHMHFTRISHVFHTFAPGSDITTLSILLSSVVTGGEDGNGLKLEQISHFFKFSSCVLKKIASKLLWFALLVKFHFLSS